MEVPKIGSSPDRDDRISQGIERVFQIRIPAVVTGTDALGRRFEEKTKISAISSREVSFRLETRLLPGSKIHLSLSVPRTLVLEKPLLLCLSGDVAAIAAADKKAVSQSVSARLDRAYTLTTES